MRRVLLPLVALLFAIRLTAAPAVRGSSIPPPNLGPSTTLEVIMRPSVSRRQFLAAQAALAAGLATASAQEPPKDAPPKAPPRPRPPKLDAELVQKFVVAGRP